MKLKSVSIALAVAGVLGFGAAALADDYGKQQGDVEKKPGDTVIESEVEKEKTRIDQQQPQEQQPQQQQQQPGEAAPPAEQPQGQPEQQPQPMPKDEKGNVPLEREQELEPGQDTGMEPQGQDLEVEPEEGMAPQGEKGLEGKKAGKLGKDKIRNVQQKLKDAGHYQGEIDGLMGPQTTSAIRKFQQEKGLPVTGKLDRQTAQALGATGGAE